MNDDELRALQSKALDSMKLARGKIEFLAQHGVINPLAMMQDRIEWLVEWMIPSHVDGEGQVGNVPTNRDRLRFDIWCNEQTIAKCDEAMGMSSGGLHIVNGRGDAPKSN